MTTATEEKANSQPAKAAAPEKTEAAKGSYAVLERTGGPEVAWREIGVDIEAGSALVAIKAVVGGDEQAKPGTYRAIPMRSWHAPITVRAEKKTVVSFEEASPF